MTAEEILTRIMFMIYTTYSTIDTTQPQHIAFTRPHGRVGIIKKHREPIVNQGVRFFVDAKMMLRNFWGLSELIKLFSILSCVVLFVEKVHNRS